MQDTAPPPTPDRLPHYVSDAPFNPGRPAPMSAALQEYYTASSYTMMWWRYRRHKIAVISGVGCGAVSCIGPTPTGCADRGALAPHPK